MFKVAVFVFLFALSAQVIAQEMFAGCSGSLILNNAYFDDETTAASGCAAGAGFCCVGDCNAGTSISSFTTTGDVGLLTNETAGYVTQSGNYAFSSVGLPGVEGGSISTVVSLSAPTHVSSCVINAFASLPINGTASSISFTLTNVDNGNVVYTMILTPAGTNSSGAIALNNASNPIGSWTPFTLTGILVGDGNYTFTIANADLAGAVSNGIYLDTICLQCSTTAASKSASKSISSSTSITPSSTASATATATSSATATATSTSTPSATSAASQSASSTNSITPSTTTSATSGPSASTSSAPSASISPAPSASADCECKKRRPINRSEYYRQNYAQFDSYIRRRI